MIAPRAGILSAAALAASLLFGEGSAAQLTPRSRRARSGRRTSSS